MTTLTITSWKKGLQVISLTEAVKQYSTGSLIRAKAEVDRLLAGEPITLEFSSELVMEEFRKRAQELGAILD